MESASPVHQSGPYLEAPTGLDIDGLTASAFVAFELLEPWYLVQRDIIHPLIGDTVDKIVREADVYFSAVAESVDAVNDGCTFATDAIALCDYISEGNSSVASLEQFLASMLELAASARQRSLSTIKKFRSVRQALYQICSELPHGLVGVEDTPDNKDNPAFITIPKPLPTNMLVGVDEKRQTLIQTERVMERYSFAAVTAQLERTQNDLDQLVRHVGLFVDWWTTLELGATSLQRTMIRTGLDGSNPGRTDSIRDRWIAVRNENATYRHRLTLIQDFYPSAGQRQKVNGEPRKGPVRFPDVINSVATTLKRPNGHSASSLTPMSRQAITRSSSVKTSPSSRSPHSVPSRKQAARPASSFVSCSHNLSKYHSLSLETNPLPSNGPPSPTSSPLPIFPSDPATDFHSRRWQFHLQPSRHHSYDVPGTSFVSDAASIRTVPADMGRPILPVCETPKSASIHDVPRDRLFKAGRRWAGGRMKRWVQNVLLRNQDAGSRRSAGNFAAFSARLSKFHPRRAWSKDFRS